MLSRVERRTGAGGSLAVEEAVWVPWTTLIFQILSWASISLTLEPSVLWRVYLLMMPTSGRRSPLYYCSFSRGLAALAMRPEIFETDRTLQSSRTDTGYLILTIQIIISQGKQRYLST